jgi:hypothetical protein
MEALHALGDFNAGLRATHSWGERVALVMGICCAASAYLFVLKSKAITPSYSSLLAVLPLVVVNAWLPTVFAARSELMSRVILALLTAWLGNFKVRVRCLCVSGMWQVVVVMGVLWMHCKACCVGQTAGSGWMSATNRHTDTTT